MSFNWNPSIQFPPRITVSAGSSSRCSAASFSVLSWQILRCSWDILSLQCFLGRLQLDFPGKPLTGVTQESSWSDVWTKSADWSTVQRVQTLCEGKLSSASSVHNLIVSCHYQQTRADHRQRRSTWIAALPSVSASSSPPQSKQRRITADVTPICCHSWTRPPDIWSPLVSFHK